MASKRRHAPGTPLGANYTKASRKGREKNPRKGGIAILLKQAVVLSTATSRCVGHNPLHPWVRTADKRHQGWQEAKSPPLGGGGGGRASGGGSFTFPPTPPTDGGPESHQDYNMTAHSAMGAFLHPEPAPTSCDVKPMLSVQQKPREGKVPSYPAMEASMYQIYKRDNFQT
ncbi:hypothetical protein AAG570_005069 [Ranatra chinensis]|uniref:Uncharacterized protein n=1 Tax=Ranatra chinensis TaxID=642074 RepID=A0ABD0XZE1_9HEMI